MHYGWRAFLRLSANPPACRPLRLETHRPRCDPAGRLGAGLLWAGGVLTRALDAAHDIFGEDDGAYGVPLILPDPATYDAPGWMT